jgi:23S rRNA (pseudouridine1915-N3)-methyltransferase
VGPQDILVLLDEHGHEYRSLEFADHLQKLLSRGAKSLVFVIGGAYGSSDAVYGRSNEKISLSRMTFSHQMVRTIFAEQLYRAFTILKGEPYHHE